MSAPDFVRISRALNGKPARATSALLLVILALLVSLAVWAGFTQIDDVVRAQARIVPSGELQMVQAAETGQITGIMVREGQRVEAGEVLLRLDPTELKAQYEETRDTALAYQARVTRIEAELAGNQPEFPAEIAERVPQVVATERALYLGRTAQLEDELSLIAAQRRILDRQADRAVTEGDLARAGRSLLDEQIALITPLVERDIEPETTLLTLRREATSLDGQIALAASDGQRIGAEKAELDDREAAAKSEYRATALQDLSQTVVELGALQTRLPALEARAGRAEIRAPVDGVVNRVMVATLGGVVGQGDILVEIVPQGDATRLEAFVPPNDIAFLRPDQPVKVRLTAYDAARYGALDGRIDRIGADAVTAPDGETSVFVVEVSYEGQLTDADGEPLDVIPGMVAEVDFLAGKKTVLDYLTRPVVRVKERAFRD